MNEIDTTLWDAMNVKLERSMSPHAERLDDGDGSWLGLVLAVLLIAFLMGMGALFVAALP